MADSQPILIRPTQMSRNLALALAALCVLLGIAGLSQWNPFDDKDQARAVINVASAVLLIGGGIGIWVTLTTVATLWTDRLELRSGYGYRVISFAGIAGVRRETRRRNRLMVEFADGGTVKIPPYFETDPDGQRWLSTIADLDDRDYEQNLDELENDPALGATPDERRETLGKIRVAARIANVVGVAVGLWVWVVATPYAWAIAAAMLVPPAAFLLDRSYHSAFSLGDTKNDPRPSLLNAYLLPVFGLLMRALNDVSMLDRPRVIAMACAAAAALTALLAWRDPRVRGSLVAIAMIALLTAAYSYGAIVHLDTLLDPSQGTVYPVTVLGKHYTGGKHERYDLDVTAWGPSLSPRQLDVPRQFYDEVQSGDRLCVRLHPGWLQIRWYDPGFC